METAVRVPISLSHSGSTSHPPLSFDLIICASFYFGVLPSQFKELFGGAFPKRDEPSILAALEDLLARGDLDINMALTANSSTALHSSCWFRRPTGA